jgi:hypothetical protein
MRGPCSDAHIHDRDAHHAGGLAPGDTLACMRRWLVTLLLTLLPLQFTWAAVAPYCGHEASPTSQHLGHHAHEHHGEPMQAMDVDAAQADEAGMAAAHPDCAQCHAGSAVPSHVDAKRGEHHESTQAVMPTAWTAKGHAPSRPERPQWLSLA